MRSKKARGVLDAARRRASWRKREVEERRHLESPTEERQAVSACDTTLRCPDQELANAARPTRVAANSLPFLRRRFRDDVFPQLSRFRHDARATGCVQNSARFLSALRRLRAPSYRKK